jgi:hypothetical protein
VKAWEAVCSGIGGTAENLIKKIKKSLTIQHFGYSMTCQYFVVDHYLKFDPAGCRI